MDNHQSSLVGRRTRFVEHSRSSSEVRMKLTVLVCLAAMIVVAFAAPMDDSSDGAIAARPSQYTSDYGAYPYGYYYDGLVLFYSLQYFY